MIDIFLFQYIVGCRDDDIILRDFLHKGIGQRWNATIDTMNCNSFKNTKIWLQSALQPENGPGDTWENYCRSTYSEFFHSNINTFPCGESCGFCDGTFIVTEQ